MIIGHQKQWQFFKKAAETGDFATSYLFAGPEKLGKKKVALEWASLFFGQDLESLRHPDLILVEPEKKEIQISQIRDLIWQLSLKPFSAPFKVALINDADLMNQEAQGALLKTLEEPRGNAILILVAEHSESFFPTILSRVQTIKFFPVNRGEIEKYLIGQEITQKEAKELTEASFGKPGVAIDFLTSPEKLKLFRQKREELNKVSEATLSFRFQYAKDLAEDPKELKELLDVWQDHFRSRLLKSVSNKDSRDKYSLARLKNIINLIQTTRSLVSSTNVNSRLALETLMLEI